MSHSLVSESRKPEAGLPEFFAVGPPRTATTWLYFVLRDHVNLPEITKEVHFFNYRYAKGLAWYQQHFRFAVEGLPIGEIDPTYFYSAHARQRIASLIPKAKIICTLRDPIDRLYSFYKLKWSAGSFRCSFARAVETDFELMESTRYAFHLAEWMRIFGKERVLTLMHEELIRDPRRYLSTACEFLSMPMINIDESELAPRNGSEKLPAPTLLYWSYLGIKLGEALLCNGYIRTMALVRRLGLRRLFKSSREAQVPPLDPAFAQELRGRIRGEIETLEGLLDADLSVWKTGKPTERPLEVTDEPLTGLNRP
jgi:Sulfotransferase domain